MNYFSNEFSKIWSNLPQAIRETDSLSLFVQQVGHLINSDSSLKMFTPTIVSYSTSEIIGTLNV
uniref:SJCHGC02001 protein n=1 Tax=Schistosoma japonicum TaxID=6182 RepID=Q5BTC7_SCHJA|nr:SJCHGC02001 protein [Schistosoma japonicum]